MAAETYKFILDMQPQALFDGMMTRYPEALDGFRRLAQLAGGVFLLLGHSQRAGDAARRGLDGMGEIIKTAILGVLIFTCGMVLGQIAQAMADAPKEVGAPVSTSGLVTKLWGKATEVANPFDVFKRPEGKNAAADANTLEGALNGASGDVTPAAGSEEDDSWLPSISDFFAKLREFVARSFVAIARVIMGVIGIVLMLLAIVVSMFIIWVMEAMRYFTLVIGAAIMPLFIGFLSTENMKGAGWTYTLSLIGIAAWPLGWALGHAITIELFDLWLRLVTGEAQYAATSAINTPSEALANVGTFASMSILQALAFGLGGLGLMLWVLLVAVVAPFLIAKTLTTGAEFGGAMLGKAVQTTASVAGKVGQAAGMAVMPLGGAAVAGGGAAAGAAMRAAPAASGGGGGGGVLALATMTTSTAQRPNRPSLAEFGNN